MEIEEKLNPNILAFIALTNEFCQTMEHADTLDEESFLSSMIRLLPRIYISAFDLEENVDISFSDNFINPSLTEDVYDQVRNQLADLLGEDDVYLEVFVEDMKYSDTPVASSISENLADLYQEFFDFLNAVKDIPTYAQLEIVALCKDNFKSYWAQTLCNVMRALNMIYCNT